MKKLIINKIIHILILLMGVLIFSFGFVSDDRDGNKKSNPVYKLNSSQESGKNGDAYRLNINNLNIPINRKGIIADVNIPDPDPQIDGSGGKFAGQVFLFSSGFFLSGFADGQLWANAVASASLVEDYQAGIVNGGGDPVMYVLNSQDEDFGQSWQDWIDAVALGADFYDGNGDGIYTPVDGNGNGKWDPDEDRPDLIGDETVWCVYSDAIPSAQRRWNTVPPYGIEIRQSVFAFASAGAIGNLVFLRYRFKYVGLGSSGEPDKMTDVYFGVWADPDVGEVENDLVGVDVPRNAGYTYGNQEDELYGVNVPCFMIDFFSGPVVYIPGETYIDNDGSGDYTPGVDTDLDTAFSVRGQIMGVTEFPGAKNLPISSFVEYINGDPSLSDPNNKEEARNYILGLDKFGIPPDPCIFPYGSVQGGVDCSTVDIRFWFSGDPVTSVGWINTVLRDQRQMTNTGPFELNKNEENEIVVAYVVGQGLNPLDGITVARKIDDGAQNIFDLNFLAPSPPPPTNKQNSNLSFTSSANFIDITWETPKQVTYVNNTPTWDLKFHQYLVYAFKTNNTADLVNNQKNSELIATYQVDNFIADLYEEDGETGGIVLRYPASPTENMLDIQTFSDPETGQIRFRIFRDPFNNSLPITKGIPYFFAIVGTAINYDALIPRGGQDPGEDGDYYLSASSFVQAVENIRQISTIVGGQQLYDPPVLVQPANQVSGAGTGEVGYDVINNSELQVANYEVTFFKDSSSAEYQMFWRMANTTTNAILVDSSLSYTFGETVINDIITQGFITKVEDQTATIGTPSYDPPSSIWYDPFDSASTTGAYYLGTDIPQGQSLPFFNNITCDYITADRLRRVELRFQDGSGKAYRYINGYIGIPVSSSFSYAAAISASDTVNKGPIGQLGVGFVDVPFTAWVVDERYEQEYQLAVGFVERKATPLFLGGNPDGTWDPGDSLNTSGEVIIIFDAPYDPAGGQIEYTGGDFNTPGGTETVWADLLKAIFGFTLIPVDASGITDEQRDIFDSPWFNAMYVLGLQRQNSNSFYTNGDILTETLEIYPYTDADVYQFSINGTTITADEEQDLWNRVNVFPNPLYGFNTNSGFDGSTPDDPTVTFSNLPADVTIKIYSLSGTLLRTLTTTDKSEPNSPYIRWDLQNQSQLRVASGMYLAIVTSPIYGDKVLKFSIIMPQKQIQRF